MHTRNKEGCCCSRQLATLRWVMLIYPVSYVIEKIDPGITVVGIVV